MDPISAESTIQMTTFQFIAMLTFLVVNTAAIVASWYRFGYRISKVERDQVLADKCIKALESHNTPFYHQQLRDDYDKHLSDSRYSTDKNSLTLEKINTTVNEIKERLNTHIAIHEDRERAGNPRTPPIIDPNA